MEASGRLRARSVRRAGFALSLVMALAAVAAPPPLARAQTAPALLLSEVSSRAAPVALDGRTVAGDVYVFVDPAEGADQVQFFLDTTGPDDDPVQVANLVPFDLGGTQADLTALPFDTTSLTDGTHELVAVVTAEGGTTETLSATFTVDNGPDPGPADCEPVACGEILVDLPYELGWEADEGGAEDGSGVGTGFTYVDQPSAGAGYVPGNLAVDAGAGVLRITTTEGIAYQGADTLDNALGVGLDLPSETIELSTTLVDVPAGSGNYEQAGLWFGTGEDDYVKLVVMSTPAGTVVQALSELGGVDVEHASVPAPATAEIELQLLVDPSDQSVRASYGPEGGRAQVLAITDLPAELFSFDAAGIDPTIGTRSFGGVFASHRRGPAPLVYSFDDFAARAVEDPDPGPGPDPGGIAFDRVSFPLNQPTSMVWGPDDRLYVTELFGTIHALTLDEDANVVADEVITTLGSRLTLGVEVDPASTPDAVVLWVGHSNPSVSSGAVNSSTVTRLSGPGFTERDDVITGLPRAIANHAINSLHFGPDGRLYIAMGGNTGAGAPNNANTEFGTRAEQPLSAALLVADVDAAGFDGSCANSTDMYGPPPCDVGTYATGLRNMYDFVFHSNGSIYGPDNGLGVTGTFPPSPTPPCDGFGDTASYDAGGENPGAQPDPLHRLEEGRYYGHPNPSRGECVYGDGSYQEVDPLPNHAPPMFSLGSKRSANGIVEYRGGAFGGALDGDLLIANYSTGDDITRVVLSADGTSVVSSESLIGDFDDPLPLTLGPDGTVYVGEFGGDRVTALVPQASVPPPGGDGWTERAALPTALLDPGGAALGDLLYVVGGKTAAGHRGDLYVYDPGADAWTSGPALPGPGVENPAVVAFDGRLYVFGGSTAPFSGAVANAAAYDPATSSWEPLPPLPTPRGGARAEVIGEAIYVVGGMAGDGSSLSSADVFDPATGTWTAGPSMATRRDNPGSAVVGGRLHVFGGRTRDADGSTVNAALTSMEVLTPGAGWSAAAPLPTGRRALTAGAARGRIQAIGGEGSGTVLGVAEEYDPVTGAWSVLPPPSTPRHGAASGTLNGLVHVVGGGPAFGGTFSAAHEVLDP